MKLDYEVLIVGAGPAGLSAAMTLGRISRSALLCDDDRPRNAYSKHVNNFPTQDGIHPAEWRRLARKDLEKYQTIKTFFGEVVSIEKSEQGFNAKLSSGSGVAIRKVILAYGVVDRMLPIPGFRELWGKSIFHCPFCHGFEIRGSKIGLIISNEMGFHALPMIQSLSPSGFLLFTNGIMKLSDEQRIDLKKKDIAVVEEKIDRFHHDGEALTSIGLDGGNKIERQYLFYNAEMPFELKSDIGESLGCKKNQFGLYEVNEFGATSVSGVFAAGDNMSLMQSVLLSCAAGVKSGAGATLELLTEF